MYGCILTNILVTPLSPNRASAKHIKYAMKLVPSTVVTHLDEEPVVVVGHEVDASFGCSLSRGNRDGV